MAATTIAREVRRGAVKRAPKRLALMGAATVTAAAMTLGPSAPHASALDVTQDVYTTGPLAGVLAGLGITSIGPIEVANVDPIGPITLTLDLNGPIEGGATALYDTVNALGFQRRNAQVTQLPMNIYDRVLPGSPRQFPATLGIGLGASDLVEAYRAEIASVTSGNADVPEGYSDWQLIAPKEKQSSGSGCLFSCPNVQPTYTTNQALLFVRNFYRPNGGIYSRFGPILNLFGMDTSMPGAGVYQSPLVPSSANSGNPKNPALRLNTATLDLTWAYDPLSDFPATLNPFSLLNTLFSSVPTDLLGGVQLKGLDGAAAGLNIASTLGILNRETLNTILGIDAGQAWYGTLLPNDLPILEPLRLPSRIINAIAGALGFDLNLGTPLADALQPALKILVNTGYTDVITPDELNTCATGCEVGGTPKTYAELGYTAYDRSFMTSGDYTTFLSQAPLTPAEWLQVPGDVVKALIGGVTDEIKKIFGITSAAVSSVPVSVSASLRGTAVQAISPTTSSDTADSTPVDPVTTVADDTTLVHAPTIRATKGGAEDTSPARDPNKATPRKSRGSASANAGAGNQAKNDSPSRPTSARPAKPAA